MPRAFTIEHDHRTTAGLQNTPYFGNRGFGIWSVVQDAVRIHNIECAVRKRKIFSITLKCATSCSHITHQIIFCLGRTGTLYRYINTRDISAIFRKHRRMTTCAGANFQDRFSSQLTQRHIRHSHMATKTEHVFQVIQRFQQVFTTNVAINMIVKRFIKRAPKGSGIRFCVDRIGHKLTSDNKA